MEKRVLILHAPFGSGHGAAAKAIAQAFQKKYPEIKVESVDVLDFAFEVFKQILPWGFVYITAKFPLLYKWFYDFYNHSYTYKLLDSASDIILERSSFAKFLKEYNPDFIISTNPLPMHLVSKTKEKNIIDILSANVCTDFGFHYFWYNKDVNYYFVSTQEIKKAFINHGVLEPAVKITGIPISSKFSNLQVEKNKIIEGLGFDRAKPVLLIIGGRIAYKKLIKVIDGIREKDKSIQIILVAGRDKLLEENLEKSHLQNDESVKVFGFVENIEKYMAIADLIVTKAGGLTVAECLALGLPLFINDIIPGQEGDNVKYLEKYGAGIKAYSVKKSTDCILKLLSNKEQLMEMKKNCLKIAKPKAAEDLADYVAFVLQKGN